MGVLCNGGHSPIDCDVGQLDVSRNPGEYVGECGDDVASSVFDGFCPVEGYRLAIFCALTSKKRQMEWLKIDAPDAWPDNENIKPLAVLSDNGPGESDAAKAVYERLDIRFRPAAPSSPQQKGGVEAIIGRAQRDQASDPGGYRRTTRQRDKDAKRLAKLFAGESQWDVERKVVEFLIEDNAKPNKHQLLRRFSTSVSAPQEQIKLVGEK